MNLHFLHSWQKAELRLSKFELPDLSKIGEIEISKVAWHLEKNMKNNLPLPGS